MAHTRSTRSSKAPQAKGPRASTGSRTNADRGASGRAANGEIANNRAVPSVSISSMDLATYKAVHAQLEAQKKAAREAEDNAIRVRNQELLEADGSDSDEEAAASAARKRRKTAQRDLSDGEEELAVGLEPVRARVQGRRPDEEPELEIVVPSDEEGAGPGDLGQRSRGEDEEEDLNVELEGIDVDDVDVDMDLGSRDGDLSNEIGTETESSRGGSNVHSKSKAPGRPKTPVSSSGTNTSKVVEKDFTPRTLRLALAAKGHVRTRTVFDEPFPRNNKISRINFAWKTIQESAVASSDLDIRQAYKRATKNTVVKSKLAKFTLYGRTGLISSIISKARDKVRAFYDLSGDPDDVRKDAEWLLKDSHFVYGGIDVKGRKVDQMKPFGCQLIVDIIEAQWFPSTSRSKLDLETTNRIYEKRDLPLNILLLSVTAIEHALKEWSANGRKACQITFSEDTAKQSYERHLGHWKYFESQMKAWPAWFKRTTLSQILANHSNFNLDAEDNDFKSLDFAALDSLAGYDREDREGEDAVRTIGEGGEVEEVEVRVQGEGAAAGVEGQRREDSVGPVHEGLE